MKNPLLVPEIRDLLHQKKTRVIKSFFSEQHEKEAAELLSLLQGDEIWKILSYIELYKRAKIFTYLDIEVQVAIIEGGSKQDIMDLLMNMSHDDRADLFQHLSKNIADKLLLFLPPKERTDVLHLTSYSADTNGAIMTSDFVTLYEDDSVEQSIRKIRREAPSKETIYYTYVLAADNTLRGFISLRKLILARPKKKVKDVMKTDMIYVFVHEHREVAAKIIEEYDLLALPVLDQQHRMLGIITYDDAIDIIREEETEDLEKLMAISGPVLEKSYLDIPILAHFRKRVTWVLILGFFGLITAMIIKGFQDTLETLIILAFYMPLLNAAGGNTGSQSATVVLRSLALNELIPGDIFKVIRKEFYVSILLSICLGFMTYVRVIYFSDQASLGNGFQLSSVALVISLALAIQVVWSTIFGAIIPIIATRLKVDPAVFSSPALTTLVDMGGIIIYFSCARLILGV